MSRHIGHDTGMLLFALNVVWGVYWIVLIFWWQFSTFPDQTYFLAVLRFISSHPYSCLVLIYPLLSPTPMVHYLLIFFSVVPMFIDLISVLDIMIQASADLGSAQGKAALGIVWSAFGLSVLTFIWTCLVVMNRYCKCGWNCFGDERLDSMKRRLYLK